MVTKPMDLDMNTPFGDRAEAGRRLAERLLALRLPMPAVVLALPRGGVPIGAVIASALGVPLDLLLVRKIGLPWQPEVALAAVVEGTPPEVVVDEDLQRAARIDCGYIEAQTAKALREIERRRALYLGGRAPLDIAGRTVIVVDDGLATGTTARAALAALRRRRPTRLVLAVPVAPHDTIEALRPEVDQVVCLAQPEPFVAVGAHYVDFHQLSDDEVLAELAGMRRTAPGTAP